MTEHIGGRGRALAAATLLTLTLCGQLGAVGRAIPPEAAECEGTACAQVSVTFDEAKGQYRVRNDSTERWIKVTASNVAAYADTCVGPKKSEYLPLSSIAGAYHADYADSGCGTAGAE